MAEQNQFQDPAIAVPGGNNDRPMHQESKAGQNQPVMSHATDALPNIILCFTKV
jgi:hypothetical protein